MSTTKTKKQTETSGLPLLIERALESYFEQLDGQKPRDLYNLFMAQVEPPLLKSVLSFTAGNKLKAAELLNLSRTTLNTKLKKYQLEQ